MPSDDKGSVTSALDKLKTGADKNSAVRKLWDHTMSKLLRKARSRLPERERGSADEEDIALSAFESFYEGVVAGKFPELNDRDSLLRLADDAMYVAKQGGKNSFRLAQDTARPASDPGDA